MGYYAEYWSTLMKGPWATSIKERFEARRTINSLKLSDKKLYTDLPKLVEREHRVTKALNEEARVVRDLKEAVADGYALAFNVSTMDMNILEAVNNLIDLWRKFDDVIARSGIPSAKQKLVRINEIFGAALARAVEKSEKGERDEYKDVALLTNESANKNHDQFMQAIRLRFQTVKSQSLLAKFAIRASIRNERRFLAAINRIVEQCRALLSRLEMVSRSRKDVQKVDAVLNQFEGFAKESASDIERAFYEAHLIKKRDFLLILKVIVNTNVLKQLNAKWVKMHFMPEAPVKAKEVDIDKIEEKIAKEFHTIAQALRISIAGLSRIKKKVPVAV